MGIKRSFQGLKIREEILNAFKDRIFDWNYYADGDVNRVQSERIKQINCFHQFLKERFGLVVRSLYFDPEYLREIHITFRKDKNKIKELQNKLKEFRNPNFACELELAFAVKNEEKIQIFLFLSKVYYCLAFRGLSEAKKELAELKKYIDNSKNFEVYFINDINKEDAIKDIKTITIKREYLGLNNSSDRGRANTIVKDINGKERLLEDEAVKYFKTQGFEAIHTDDYRREYRFLFSKEQTKEKKEIPMKLLDTLEENDIKFEMGVPDLLVWNPKNTKEFFFCEVKSENDTISHFQQDWINAYKDKVKIEILKIINNL